jgi:hypothetical protein
VNRSFLAREWGAVSFVVTVAVGLVIVPLALLFGNHGPQAPPNLGTTSPAAPSAASSPR